MLFIMIMIHKHITIREDQEEWVKENHINLSRFVQAKIDEEMKKYQTREKK